MTANNWPLQRDCDAFYGNPRGNKSYDPKWAANNLVHVLCPWPLHVVDSHGGVTGVPYIAIHKKCADSLKRVLDAVWKEAKQDVPTIHKWRYDIYDGSFNYRPMRGSARLSMHSYGVALDFDAEDNPFQSKKHLFTPDSPIVRAFKAETWVWGGDWSSPDSMHFQAARVK